MIDDENLLKLKSLDKKFVLIIPFWKMKIIFMKKMKGCLRHQDQYQLQDIWMKHIHDTFCEHQNYKLVKKKE